MTPKYLLSGLCLVLSGACFAGAWWSQGTDTEKVENHLIGKTFTDHHLQGSSKINSDVQGNLHWQLMPGYAYPFVGWLWTKSGSETGCFDVARLEALRIRLQSPSHPGDWFFVNAKTHDPLKGPKTFRQSAQANGQNFLLPLENFSMPEWYAIENKISPDKQHPDWGYLCSLEVLIQKPNADQGSLKIDTLEFVYGRGPAWPWLSLGALFLVGVWVARPRVAKASRS